MFCADVLTATNLECIYPCKLLEIDLLYTVTVHKCIHLTLSNAVDCGWLLGVVHCRPTSEMGGSMSLGTRITAVFHVKR